MQVSCPHCHEMNGPRTPGWPYCRNCGHRADVCRLECDCPRCRPGKGLYPGAYRDVVALGLVVLLTTLAIVLH